MKIAFYTLGCKVNTYETDSLISLFLSRGYEVVDFEDIANVYVINTCTVTATSDAKSRKMIRHAKKLNPDAIVCAIGCYIQSIKEKCDFLEEADILLGNNNKHLLPDLIDEFIYKKSRITNILDIRREKEFEDLSSISFEHTRAFIKIEDGCDNFCSYCLIPYVRGPVRSKPHQKILDEVGEIVRCGYLEIVLAGIHTGKYNDNGYELYDLLVDLLKIKGLKRIRISSIEINEINDKIIELFENNSTLAAHLHLPLQSGSNEILSLMRRKYDKETYLERLEKIRIARPDIAISTDVIVGFPLETDSLFLETLDTCIKAQFSKIHVFPFSAREGTLAYNMKQVLDSDKKKRVQSLIALSNELEEKYESKFVGQIFDVIIETRYDEKYMIGHTTNYLKCLVPYDASFLKKDVEVKIVEYRYPYCICEVV